MSPERQSGPAARGPAPASGSTTLTDTGIVRRSGLRCACGKAMVATDYSSSGTTWISKACPVLVEFWGPGRYGWHKALPPHQFEVRTKPEHAATGCCDIREVQVYP